MRTIAIINQKGGSGKTTTAINLAAVLSKRDQRTLLVDVDPQAHCALGLAIPENQIEKHIGDAMLATADRALDPNQFVWRVNKMLHVAPSTTRLAGLEASRGGLAERPDRDSRLANVLEGVADSYEWCLIDCPPFIGLLTFNALRAADEVLIPVETGYFAMQGAEKQVATIRALTRRFERDTPYHILPTMHEGDSTLACEVLAELKRKFASRVVPVVVRRDGKLRECASMGTPIVDYDPVCDGANDYESLGGWVIETLGRKRRAVGSGSVHVSASVMSPIASSPAVGGAFLNRHAESVAVATPPISRAAELAERTRRLAQRSAGPSMSHEPVFSEPARTSVRESVETTPLQHASTAPDRLFGVRETSRGLLFVQPGGPSIRICIASDLNEWSPDATPMRYNERLRVHEATVPAPAGVFHYRLVVNGQWMTDPYNPLTEPNPFGGHNSVFLVTSDHANGRANDGE